MKKFFAKIIFLVLYFFIFIQLSYTQSIRYDTVPHPYKEERQLYHLEQQASNRPATVNRVEEQPVRTSSFDPSRLIFGGSFGLTFGSYTTINISPQLGYAFTDNFSAGFGIGYNYYDYSDHRLSVNYLGANLYARYHPIRYLSLQIQPEIYGTWGRQYGNSLGNRTVPVVLIGAGGIIPVTNRSGISIMFYYDLVQDDWSPYEDELFYTIGYTFRF